MSLYLNIYDYANDDYPFQIFIGGRGIGKTFGAYKGALNIDAKDYIDGKFVWMRRTQKELELMLDTKTAEGVSDLKKINDMYGTDYGFKAINPNIAGIYYRERNEEGKPLYVNEPVGYGVALSTIASIRGMNFSDCTDIIYDEFIPEQHVYRLRNECDALLNAYETINRNRELEGGKPVRLWLLANSNDIYNQIMVGLDLVRTAERMVRRGEEHFYDKKRGLALHIMKADSEFAEKKAETALYKLVDNSEYKEMALNNNFAYNDFSAIEYVNCKKGWVPIVKVDNCTIMRKKGEKQLYVTYSQFDTKLEHIHTNEERQRMYFREHYAFVKQCIIRGVVRFESYEIKETIYNLVM